MATILGIAPTPNTIIFRKLCYFIVLALFISIANQPAAINVEATEFDDLSEQQKEAAIALLKQAMSETKVDPLEIIRHGIEKVKEEEKHDIKTSTNVSSEDELEVLNIPAESKAIEHDTTTSSNVAEPSDDDTTSATALPDTTSTLPYESEHQVEEHELAQAQASSNVSDKPEEQEHHVLAQEDQNEERERSLDELYNRESTKSEPSIVQSDLTDDSHQDDEAKVTEPLHQRTELEHETPKFPDDAVAVPKKVSPVEADFEDTYIDRSDPKNPRKVQVKKKNKSRIGPNGSSHEQLESKIITSIGNNPNAYSRHSSSSSFSSSSSTNGKRPGKNWVFDQMQRLPSLPALPQMPQIPPIPPMPLMPYGLPIAGAWQNYYGQGMEDYGEFGQSGAYATAMAGMPGAFYGYPASNEGYISKRQAKKQRRAARRAAREREFNY